MWRYLCWMRCRTFEVCPASKTMRRGSDTRDAFVRVVWRPSAVGNSENFWDLPKKEVLDVLGYRFHRDGKGVNHRIRTAKSLHIKWKRMGPPLLTERINSGRLWTGLSMMETFQS